VQIIENENLPLGRALDFRLPPELEASEPPEARGLARDEVRLLVSYCRDDTVEHTQFRQIADFFQPGDVLVINTSGTLNAALNATRQDGTPLELHLSTHLPADLWIVEVRQPTANATEPFYHAGVGEMLQLPGGAHAKLLTPYMSDRQQPAPGKIRLWIATLQLPEELPGYLQKHGFPIRYDYVNRAWDNSYYQTVYATELGSAEMPSAGRAFTLEVLAKLAAKGVTIVPLVLHTGVASLEDHEPPYEEYYRVPLGTARAINAAKAAGRRVVAVGTTVIRALETVTDEDGTVHPGEGWTRVIVTPENPVRSVDSLLTGLHEPRATHLAMLEGLAGLEHLQVTYAAALQERYLWHEFGDLHLILGDRS
jgi:S-adenosylmethionine:tRNA ribosyltransferase-isomerase